jgi:hypothetical protein
VPNSLKSDPDSGFLLNLGCRPSFYDFKNWGKIYYVLTVNLKKVFFKLLLRILYVGLPTVDPGEASYTFQRKHPAFRELLFFFSWPSMNPDCFSFFLAFLNPDYFSFFLAFLNPDFFFFFPGLLKFGLFFALAFLNPD